MDSAEDLFRRAQAGDQDALEEFVRRYEPRILQKVKAKLPRFPKVREKERHSDILQSVLREFVEKKDRLEYRGEGALVKLLSRMVMGKIGDKHDQLQALKRGGGRRIDSLDQRTDGEARASQPDPQVQTPSKEAMKEEEKQLLDEAIAELPEDQQEAIRLHRQNLSNEEIGERMSRTPDAARKLIARAQKTLTRHLRDHRRER